MDDPILQHLVTDQVLTQEQAETAQQGAAEKKQPIEDFLRENNLANEEQLTQARGKVFNIPYVDLTGKEIESDVLRLIPEDTAKHYKVVAYQKSESEVNVGVVDPRDFKALEAVEFIMKEHSLQPFYFIISDTNFNNGIKNYSGLGEQVDEVLDIAQEKFGEKEEEADEDVDTSGDITQNIKRAPVSKIVSVIIKHAVDNRASDIHIEPEQSKSRVRYRVDGIMSEALTLPVSLHNSVVSRIKVLSDMKLDETRRPQDGRIRVNFGKRRVDLRVSILPLVQSEKVVMRILDTSGKVPKLPDLGYSERNVNLIEESMRRSYGLFLVTGPTGSGKSTTLNSVLNILNEESVNIITLEDPSEFYIPGVNQSQVNPDVGFSFSSGLRAILRQDPDIIMVGEIRDEETGELAVHAALTGHIVFSTLHTNTAIGAIPRLADMEIEPFLLSSTLGGVIGQRLVRKICEHCKVEMTLPKQLEEKVRTILKDLPDDARPEVIDDESKPLIFFRGNGCVRCNDSGYRGRTSISEVIVVDDRMKEIIGEGASLPAVEKAAKAQGFISMQQDGYTRALEGITSVEEVMRVMQV